MAQQPFKQTNNDQVEPTLLTQPKQPNVHSPNSQTKKTLANPHLTKPKAPKKRKETPSGTIAHPLPSKQSSIQPTTQADTVGEDEISSNSPTLPNSGNQLLGDGTEASLVQPSKKTGANMWVSRMVSKKHRFSPYKLEDVEQQGGSIVVFFHSLG
ncbi:uncharacterized protein LOC108999528 isoform X2 [Juglans regia]|uniref:Uncharacterized protein LOC108999528 isoform X2 n=1 Tax=Juglans regia TaxID=51240 RepID=A0A6P9EML4_JUGRE|nr:uncharacterized protein LOC108999528 isoform X2 [Juglans regia]